EDLYAASAAAYHAATFNESLQSIAERAPKALGVDACILSLLSDDGKELVVVAATGQFATRLLRMRADISSASAERIIAERKMVVIEDAQRDSSITSDLKRDLQIGSLIQTPLYHSNGRPMGMLTILRHRPSLFPDAQRMLFKV